jgi:hypothetical protein
MLKARALLLDSQVVPQSTHQPPATHPSNLANEHRPSHAPCHRCSLQGAYGVPWSHICWLNPTLPCSGGTLPAGSTICVRNGATPPDYFPQGEPTSEWRAAALLGCRAAGHGGGSCWGVCATSATFTL